MSDRILGREYARETGGKVGVDMCAIDANWGLSTDLVYQFCRRSSHSRVLIPSHGRYIGAASNPINERKRARGDRVGLQWRIPAPSAREGRGIRRLLYDTNFWKSFVMSRLALPQGDPGSLTIYGRGKTEHRLLAEHFTAETPVKTEGRGRTVDEWQIRQKGIDNHWWDAIVGAAVLASTRGCSLPSHRQPAVKRRRVRASERVAAKRGVA